MLDKQNHLMRTMGRVREDSGTVYQECIQYDVTAAKMGVALEAILPGGSRREEVLTGIRECVEKLGSEEHVSQKVAEEVLDVLGGNA